MVLGGGEQVNQLANFGLEGDVMKELNEETVGRV